MPLHQQEHATIPVVVGVVFGNGTQFLRSQSRQQTEAQPGPLEMGVDERKERYRAFLDDVDQPNLKTCHRVGCVDQAQLETSGTLRVIPKQAALDAIHIRSLIHKTHLKTAHIIYAGRAANIVNQDYDD